MAKTKQQLPMREFSQSLPMMLLRARECVMARFRVVLNEYGVTEQQWRILRALYEEDGVDISELADQCCLLMPSLSRILKSMEERDLITRWSDANDGRRTLVEITSEGRSLIDVVSPLSESQYKDMNLRVGAKNMHTLYVELEHLIKCLEESD